MMRVGDVHTFPTLGCEPEVACRLSEASKLSHERLPDRSLLDSGADRVQKIMYKRYAAGFDDSGILKQLKTVGQKLGPR